MKWYRKAAEQGHAAAQFYLGVMCREGEGVPKDDAEAVKSFLKAADKGFARRRSSILDACTTMATAYSRTILRR